MVQYIGDSEEADDIVECVDTILSTPFGDMPYMRSMGIASGVLGVSSPDAEAEFFNQSVDQVETWEDRANITEIEMESQNGLMIPKVVIEDGE